MAIPVFVGRALTGGLELRVRRRKLRGPIFDRARCAGDVHS